MGGKQYRETNQLYVNSMRFLKAVRKKSWILFSQLYYLGTGKRKDLMGNHSKFIVSSPVKKWSKFIVGGGRIVAKHLQRNKPKQKVKLLSIDLKLIFNLSYLYYVGFTKNIASKVVNSWQSYSRQQQASSQPVLITQASPSEINFYFTVKLKYFQSVSSA